MPRQVRLEYAGAFYHVLARGDRREPIVCGEDDRALWLRTLGEACAKTGWQVHAWVLLDNHYHLALETPTPNLVAGMRWFQNTYTRRFNTRHRQWGHLFGDRYKAVPVEPERNPGGGYAAALIDYIHLNPVRAGLVRPERGCGLLDYRWSSLGLGYGLPRRQRPAWLETAQGLAAGGWRDDAAGRRRYVASLEARARTEAAERCGYVERAGQTLPSTLTRGWYWGSQAFRERLLAMLGADSVKRKRVNRNYETSAQAQARRLAEAEGVVRSGLAALGLTEQALAELKGSDPRKVAIAAVLHTRTTVPQAWLAERLRMRSPANVSQQVRRFLGLEEAGLAPAVRRWMDSVKNC